MQCYNTPFVSQSVELAESDSTQHCSRYEIDVLELWLQVKNEKLTRIKTVQDFTLAVAYIGGFMSRKAGVHPGPKKLCEGLRRLEDLLAGYRLAMLRRSDKR